MPLHRSTAAVDPRRFGRATLRILAIPPEGGWRLGDDVKLFATTFVAGFLFVSILIS
jgi:hypothetical protein